MSVRVAAWAVVSILVTIAAPVGLIARNGGEVRVGRDRYSDGLYKWTTSDSIAVRMYTRVPGGWRYHQTYPVATYSPDNRYFFVMTFRGEIGCGCTLQALEVYDVERVRRWLASSTRTSNGLPPLRRVEMQTRDLGSGLALASPSWVDSNKIAFIGRDLSDVLQVFRLDVRSGLLDQMTREPPNRDLNFLSARGSAALYRRRMTLPTASPDDLPLLLPAPRNDAGDIQFRAFQDESALEWRAAYGGGESWTVPIGARGIPEVWMSPDGRFAIIAATFQTADRASLMERFVLVDFIGRQARQLALIAVDGQAAWSGRGEQERPTRARALWTADGTAVLLVNAQLPRGQGFPGVADDVGYIAAYDVANDRLHPIEALSQLGAVAPQVRQIGWLTPGQELLVAREIGGRPTSGTVYARAEGRWVGSEAAANVSVPSQATPVASGTPTITLRQSPNDPPVLVAADGSGERVLSRPDPALAGVWRATVEPFTFQMPSGQSVTAMLSMPRDFVRGRPVPLVIQNSYSTAFSSLFLPDGHVASGFARQALVAEGIAVLDLPIIYQELRDSDPPERRRERGNMFVARLDAAVGALARQGLVDPTRVGIIGHSQTGYQAHYAVTHPGAVTLAAAEVWDSATASLSQYLQGAVVELAFPREQFEGVNGGPYWANRSAWNERDVTMNADRVETPTLFVNSRLGPISARPSANQVAVEMLATAGAFQLNQRPIELMFTPEGGHDLPATRLRRAAMDLTVDWMNFWLQRREDPNPAKADQYRRWRLIRRREEERRSREVPLPSRANSAESVTAVQAGARTASVPRRASATEDELSSNRAAAVGQVHEEMRARHIPEVGSDVNALNALGYRALYEQNDPASAVQYFRWNLILFPQYAAQLEDSLAEGYLQAGDRDRAVEHYRAALHMRPEMRSRYEDLIARLQHPANLLTLQRSQRTAYERGRTERRSE